MRIRPDIYGLDEAYARALDSPAPRQRLATTAAAAAHGGAAAAAAPATAGGR